MRTGRCSRARSGRRKRAGVALLASLALGTLPSAVRAQDEPPGGIELPNPGRTELPEVKVIAPKEEPPKPPPKPAVAEKPARPQEPVAPRRVVAPKPPLVPKPAAASVQVAEPAAAPVRVAKPVAAPPPPAPEPIAAASALSMSRRLPAAGSTGTRYRPT